MAEAVAAEVVDVVAPPQHDEIGENELFIKSLVMKSAVGVVTYPLTLVKTLFQLGYEPYPLTQGKSLLFLGRDCYFLPNGLVYARHLLREVGVSGLLTGLEAAVFANLTGGFVSYTTAKYMDQYFPELGGKPDNVKKEQKDLTDHEAFRLMIRTAMRESVARAAGVVVSRPFTVFMVRKIAQLIGNEMKYNSLLECILKVGRQEGPAGFFSGLVPALIAEAITIWGINTCSLVIERALYHMEIDNHAADDEQAKEHAANTRRLLHLCTPFFVNTYAYPFQVVSTVMAAVGSDLAVSMLPYAPTFSIWQDAWYYLKPFGLRRGARLFLREQRGAVSVGADNQLYANYKHFS